MQAGTPSRRTTRKRLAALLALGAAAFAFVALTPSGNAASDRVSANNVPFTDSTGEDAASADLSTVVVSNDDQGNISFVITVTNRPTLTGDMFVAILVDADSNPATGDADLLGSDYIIELDGPLQGAAGVGLLRWNGSDFSGGGVPQSSLSFSYANGATIKVSAADLGATKRFNFAVLSGAGIVLDAQGQPDLTNVHYDFAPDAGHGFWTYDVKLKPPTLVVQSFTTKPAKPTAGHRVSASLVFGRSDGSPPDGTEKVACRATLGGRVLAPVSTTLINGRAGCAWALPKTAKGQTLRITITIRSGSLKTAKTVTVKVG